MGSGPRRTCARGKVPLRRLYPLRSIRFVVSIALLLLLTPGSSRAVSLGLQMTILVNGHFWDFVPGGPVGVTPTGIECACSGNAVYTFIIQLDQVATLTSFATSIAALDPSDIDFVNGSAVDLSGTGFAALTGNPNNSLNDATPGSGWATAGALPPPCPLRISTGWTT